MNKFVQKYKKLILLPLFIILTLKKLIKHIVLIFILLSNVSFAQMNSESLEISNYQIQKFSDIKKSIVSGDLQTSDVNSKLTHQIQVQVVDGEKNPIANQIVTFKFQNFPPNANGQKIETPKVLTNANGIAKTDILLGSQKGNYSISATIKSESDNNFVVFNQTARKSNWLFILIISVLGGLGFFLFGMYLMSRGLQKSAGDKMRIVLTKLTTNRYLSLGVGAFVATVIQSSSATTVMLISFVNAKLISFRNTLGVILGAGIGSTITTQLIAFSLAEYSLLVVALGFFLYYFVKVEKIKNIGESLFGFGILFYGMQIMSDSMSPLKSYDSFLNILVTLENPVLGILVGALFTALIQSAAAFIGILIILSSQGLLGIDAGIPLVLGSAIGTAVTALLATIGTSRDAYKVAMAHTVLKTFGVFIFVWWIPSYTDLVKYISPKLILVDGVATNLGDVIPRQLANAHAVYNILLTITVFPFINQFAWVIEKIVPDREIDKPDELKTKFIDYNIVQSPSLALSLAKQETIQMAYLVRAMHTKIMIPFVESNSDVILEIEKNERQVNFLRDEINAYLMRISRYNVEENRINEAFQILYTVKELEQIADIISTSLCKKAKSWVHHNHEFSEEGLNELIAYHTSSLKQLSRAIEVFRDVNLEKAKHVNQKYEQYESMAFELEKKHYERLVNQVDKTLSSSKTHILLMDMFKQISEHSTNIARILLKWSNEKKK